MAREKTVLTVLRTEALTPHMHRVYLGDPGFDGFTPTFTHPTLRHDELTFLLGSAYTQYYMRPSFLTNYLRIRAPRVRALVESLDAHVRRRHARELAVMGRSC